MDVILITGTSKGLGYELATQYLHLGWRVIGLSRHTSSINNDNYHHCIGDVTDNSIGHRLGEFIDRLKVETINIVINNAGTGSYGNHLSEVNPDEVLNQVNLHCVGTLRIVKAVQQYLTGAKIVNMTSRLASVEQNQRGDFAGKAFSYSYRIAKCAQNMLSLCLANDDELSKVTILSINPGLLRTDSGSNDAKFSAKEGATAVISTINNASASGIYHAFSEDALY